MLRLLEKLWKILARQRKPAKPGLPHCEFKMDRMKFQGLSPYLRKADSSLRLPGNLFL